MAERHAHFANKEVLFSVPFSLPKYIVIIIIISIDTPPQGNKVSNLEAPIAVVYIT